MTWLSKLLRKVFTIRDQQQQAADSDTVKPFLDHLEDLRGTLFKMAAVLAVGMVIAFFFKHDLMRLVLAPLQGENLVTLNLTEGFMISLRLAFYAGIVFTFPLLLFFAAEFILPALTRKEKRMLIPGIVIGFLLFGCGVWVSYIYILPHTIQWFRNYSLSEGLTVTLQAGPYFGFVTHLTIACGLLCELPIVVIALALFGIVSYKLLSKTRAYAMLLIGILVAVISPSPDPITFITLSLPVISVYELCIWIVWLIERRKKLTP